MDLQTLNIELFEKLTLAIAIIRNTPKGIKPDVFTRCLSKRLFPRLNQQSIIYDEYLLRRQNDLLSRLKFSIHSKLSTSISMMDFMMMTNEKQQLKQTNEYEYGEFAEKVCKLKDKKRLIKIDDIEYLLRTISKWLNKFNQSILPIDACLYTIQLIANQLKTDNDKPYHIILELLPIIDKFIDYLFDILEEINENYVYYLHQMIISLASSNSCISRLLDRLLIRLSHLCENSDMSSMDSIDRLFNILHEIIHNRSCFQMRLSQRSIEKIYTFINQVSPLLDGQSNFTHTLKLQGQLQAGNYRKFSDTSIRTFPSYTSSSSSSEHSQYQQQKYYSNKLSTSSKINSLDYSMSQSSQYF